MYISQAFLLFLTLTSYTLSAKSTSEGLYRDFKEECYNNQTYLDLDYDIFCDDSYHHYNPNAHKKYYSKQEAILKGDIKIAHFNVLHPGIGKTRFKNYKILAQTINQFDIVAVTELIPSMSKNLTNNNNVIKFLKDTPKNIQQLDKKIKDIETQLRTSQRGASTKNFLLALLKKKSLQLKKDHPNVIKLFRPPGYLRILNELHQTQNGHEWSLILSPKPEGSLTSNIPELIGYYYRSSKSSPKENSYCQSIQSSDDPAAPFACIINMDKNDMGEDKRDAFSRRPFLAEFSSGNFSFTLLSSHVLFKSPTDPERMKNILMKSFGVSHYKDLGRGVTQSKYARFAEVKMTLDFISRNLKKKYSRKDIIFMGDFNLEKTNPFWRFTLKHWKGSKLFIDNKTSLSFSRYNSDQEETYGEASNYDHFIFNPKKTTECISPHTGNLSGGVFQFIENHIGDTVRKMYSIRKKNLFYNSFLPLLSEKDPIRYTNAIDRYITPLLSGKESIYTVGTKYIVEGDRKLRSFGIIADNKESEKYASFFKERVLDSQLSDSSFYNYFVQLLSDHFPIYMSCSTI